MRSRLGGRGRLLTQQAVAFCLRDGWAAGSTYRAPKRPILQASEVAFSLLTLRGMKTQRWRVLIVDDHAPSRAAVAEAVGAQGGAVVGNGSRVEDAVRLVDKHRPDVLLLAVGLPDGDGVQLLEEIRATPSANIRSAIGSMM